MLPTVMFLMAALQLQVACEGRNASGREDVSPQELPKQRVQRKAASMMQTSTVFQSAVGLVGAQHIKHDDKAQLHSERRHAKDGFNVEIANPRIPDPFFGLEDAFDQENAVEAAALRSASMPAVSAEWLGLLSTIFIDLLMGGLGAATFLYLRAYFADRPKAVEPKVAESKMTAKLHKACSGPASTATTRADACDDWGCSPLHLAAASGDRDAAKALLQQNVDVNAREAWEETPLHFAARAGHVELCKLLLGHGAEIDATGLGGETPLVVGAKARKEAVCQLLLLHGGGCAGLREDELPELLVKMILERFVPQKD